MTAPRKSAQRLCAFAIVVLALCSLTPYVPVSVFLTDIPSHFVLQYAIGCVVLSAATLWLRLRHFYFLLLGIAFALNMASLAPYLDRHTAQTLPAQNFKVLQANVLTENRNTALLETMIEQEKPDIIVLAEINDAFRAMASALKPQYPYQTMRHKVALLSRHPAVNVSADPALYKAAHISALTVTFDNQTIDIVTLHTPTPLQNLSRRDAELAEVADFIGTRKNHVIFAGDINATPWCPAVQHFAAQTGLTSARRHQGVLPSWPRWLPASFLRIPIDHIFVDPRLIVLDYRLGSSIGSDHLPTIGIFGLLQTQPIEK